MLTPRFALNYQPNDDVLLFASATRGFRSGGWNVRGTTAQLFTPFKPEKAWTYEAGAKSEWFDNRLRANLTFFYLIDKQYQSPSAFVDAIGVHPVHHPQRRGLPEPGRRARTAGGAGRRPEPVRSASAYQDAKYKNVAANTLTQQADCRTLRATGWRSRRRCGAGIVTAQGEIAEPVRTPELTLAVGWLIRLPVGENWKLTPAVNVVHQSDTETAAANAQLLHRPERHLQHRRPGQLRLGLAAGGVYGGQRQRHAQRRRQRRAGSSSSTATTAADETYTQSAIFGLLVPEPAAHLVGAPRLLVLIGTARQHALTEPAADPR